MCPASLPLGVKVQKNKKKSLILSLLLPADPSTIETNEEIEIAYPITCGESKAILLWKKFVCPGINVKCVKVTCLL